MKNRKIEFLELYRKFIKYYTETKNPKHKKKKATLDTYEYRYNNIRNYLEDSGLSNVPAEKFTIRMVKELYNYMDEVSEDHNYKVRACNQVNLVLSWGVNEEIIKVNQVFMFSIGQMEGEQPPYLYPDQLRILANLELPEELAVDRDCFLFMCYSGMVFCDAVKASERLIQLNVNDGKYYVVYQRQKTGVVAIVPFFEDLKMLWERYGYSMPFRSNASINGSLKEIGRRCAKLFKTEIEWECSAGRDTFANIKLNHEGFQIESVSRMLGHKRVQTTEKHYAKVNLSGVSMDVARRDAAIHNMVGTHHFTQIAKAW